MNAVLAILDTRCPHCRKGPMFEKRLLENPLQFSKMHTHCPACGTNYYPELGFYIGAMYFTYAVNAGVVITTLILMLNMGEFTAKSIMFTTLCLVFLLVPINFRISRALMLHLFGGISYDPEARRATTASTRQA